MCDMKRSEQRVENTWKMEDIYASMEAYNADVQKVQALLKEYEALQGTLGTDTWRADDAEYILVSAGAACIAGSASDSVLCGGAEAGGIPSAGRGGHKNARPYPGYKDGGAAGEDE